MANIRNCVRFNSTYSTIDAYIINAGKQYKAEHSFGPFANDFHVLQYIKSGKGTFFCNNQSYNLMPGDIFFLPKNFATQYAADKEDPYEYYWIAFDGVYASKLLKTCNLTPGNPVIHVNNDKIRKCFSDMFNLFAPSDAERSKNAKSLSLFYELFAELLKITRSESDSDNEDSPILNRIIAYIDANYAKNVTITSVCAKFRVDRSHFYDSFRKKKNMTPKEYIEMLRMTEAAKLLESTNSPAYAIAYAVGLPQNRFTNHFKAAFSCTPSEYRKLKNKPKILDNHSKRLKK